MKTTSAITRVLAVAALLVGVTAAPAAADDRVCTGAIGAETIDDNVIVPTDADCTLDGTTVGGNVLVGPRAQLTVTGASIEGNIQDDNNDAGAVSVTGTQIGGSIQLFDGDRATVRSSFIDGDLQYESNSGPLVADDNDISGNLQANQNTGGVTITDNVIDGNLQCESNDPAPTGGGNTVHGDAEGQCADLTPAAGGFTDVQVGSTHATAINWLVDAGITQGCTADGNRYCPSDPVTRAQMATFLDRALDLPAGATTFDDVAAGSTHAASIAAVADAGITQGCTADGNRYCPSDPVTRAQMASFLHRALAS